MTGSSGTIVAKVHKIVTGHSERSLVHAVEDSGLEHKLELPTELLREVIVGQDHVLMLSWTLQALPQVPAQPPAAPGVAGPPPTPSVGGPTPLPSAVDEEFMAMMARGRRKPAEPTAAPSPVTAPSPAPTSAGTSAAEQLAVRLGLRPDRSAS